MVLVNCLTLVLRIYHKYFSPMLGTRCRFYPSCSVYAHDSFKKYGAFRGGVKTTGRLLRCHPFHPGGVDLP